MSLAIDTNKVVGVTIGGKETLILEGSFDLDAYEFRYGDRHDDFIGSGLGYHFRTEEGGYYYGPIEAIQMVEVSG